LLTITNVFYPHKMKNRNTQKTPTKTGSEY
jgi:hypothetical protein